MERQSTDVIHGKDSTLVPIYLLLRNVLSIGKRLQSSCQTCHGRRQDSLRKRRRDRVAQCLDSSARRRWEHPVFGKPHYECRFSNGQATHRLSILSAPHERMRRSLCVASFSDVPDAGLFFQSQRVVFDVLCGERLDANSFERFFDRDTTHRCLPECLHQQIRARDDPDTSRRRSKLGRVEDGPCKVKLGMSVLVCVETGSDDRCRNGLKTPRSEIFPTQEFQRRVQVVDSEIRV